MTHERTRRSEDDESSTAEVDALCARLWVQPGVLGVSPILAAELDVLAPVVG